jgi:hypothetical protein
MTSQPRNALHNFFRESIAAEEQSAAATLLAAKAQEKIAIATKQLAERQVKRENIPGLVIGLVQYLERQVASCDALERQVASCDALAVSSITDSQQRQAAEHLGFNDASLKDLCRAICPSGAGQGAAAKSVPPASPPPTMPPGKGSGHKP